MEDAKNVDMSEDEYSTTTNGDNNQQQQQQQQHQQQQQEEEKETSKHVELKQSVGLYDAVSSLLAPIFFPHDNTSTIFKRTKDSFRNNLPDIADACRDSGAHILNWARSGTPLRLLLVISVGTITLLTLTGILVFLLFLAAATTNAIILSIFMSLAAAGGFFAIFFACLAAIYIGALSVAVFVISSLTVSAIIAALIVTGWIGFFWIIWITMSKSVGIAKNSASFTGSALSAWRGHRHHRD